VEGGRRPYINGEDVLGANSRRSRGLEVDSHRQENDRKVGDVERRGGRGRSRLAD
jgi:hypothetical protein